jgi:hypothetical protein
MSLTILSPLLCGIFFALSFAVWRFIDRHALRLSQPATWAFLGVWMTALTVSGYFGWIALFYALGVGCAVVV